MIGKISKGANFKRVVHYVLDKSKKHTMLAGAKQCYGENADEIISGFEEIAKLGNSRLPMRHYSIAFAPGDSVKDVDDVKGVIDDETKSEIVNRIMDEMGFGDCQYFAVAHDRDDPGHREAHTHDHIHIVANATTPGGRRVPDSWDYYKLQESLRKIEIEYGFREVLNSWERKSIPSPAIEKTELQTTIDQSLEDLPDMKTWIDRMEAQGVNLRFKITSRGCIQGVSYISDGELVKGADAERGWKSLANKFGESPTDAKLALAANIKTQSLPVVLRRYEQEQLVKAAELAVEILAGKERYKDKSVEIKLFEGTLTVNRLRPNKQILRATRCDDKKWQSIGVPDIDEKKDLNLLRSIVSASTAKEEGFIIEDDASTPSIIDSEQVVEGVKQELEQVIEVKPESKKVVKARKKQDYSR